MWKSAITSLVLTAATVLPISSAGASDLCPDDLATENDVCATSVATRPLSATEQAELAQEDAEYEAEYEALLAGVPTPTDLALAIGQPGGGGSGSLYVLNEVANMDIYKEGEGNGKKNYTCGPAASRNMIAALYKRKTGAYRDFGEYNFEVWEGTKEGIGTANGNVATALNEHFDDKGTWKPFRPADRDAYLARVAITTYSQHTAVIANINTGPLDFWRGKNLGHYDVVYGFDSRDSSARYVYIAEEWDPVFIYGSMPIYGNPYGHHKEPLLNAFKAENNLPSHRLVA